MKGVPLVVLVVVLGLVLVAGLISSAAWANHIPGATYDGSTSTGGSLTFTVSADGSGIDVVTVGDPGGSACPSAFTVTIGYQGTPEGPLPIVNHAFKDSDPPYLFEGSFPGTGTAQGSFEYPLCSSVLSWSATIHSPPESPPPPSAPGTHPPSVPGAAPTCGGKAATIVGTNGKDVRKGTPGRDVMVGLAGNDKLSGLAGNDLICGGSGKDTLKGGKGKDKLYGQKGKDTLKGGAGKDILKSGGKDKNVQSPAPLPLSDSEADNAARYDAYQRFLSSAQGNNPDAFWGVEDCSRVSTYQVRCRAFMGFFPLPFIDYTCQWVAVVTRVGYAGLSLSREDELCA